MANVKQTNEQISLKLGSYAVFGSLIINPLSDWYRHFEFSKFDSKFVISVPENLHIRIFIKIGNFRSFVPPF